MANENLSIPKSQVRWFYKAKKLKQWLPFGGSDSLELETVYQTIQPKSPSHKLEKMRNRSEHRSSLTTENSYDTQVPVFDGLYEVDLQALTYHPVYWNDPKFPLPVLRGTWFRANSKGLRVPLDDQYMLKKLEQSFSRLYTPVNSCSSLPSISEEEGKRCLPVTFSVPVFDECLQYKNAADSFEAENRHRSASDTPKLKKSPKTSKTMKKTPLTTIRFNDCHVKFYGPDDVYLYHDTNSYIRKKLGMRKVGTRLYRGYGVEAVDNDRRIPITHLCFVVHGIGQKALFRPILKTVNAFRNVCEQNRSKYFTDPTYANQRVEFLPVEWRCSLQLAADAIDSITPFQIRRVRHTLNSSAMDIMYYTSPLYRTEITANLSNQLNRLYSKFCHRNPNFESNGGKVSIIAHSLGCVLMYDLITGWSQPLFDYPTCDAGSWVDRDEPNSTKTKQRAPKLSFIHSLSQAISPDVLQRVSRVSIQLENVRSQAHRLETEISNLLCNPNSPSETKKLSLANGSTIPCFSDTATHIRDEKHPLLFLSRLANFFCMGSPLGVYLALRGIRPSAGGTQDTILPRSICPRIFNIYHPSDPVAYRLEPLVLQHYTSVEPIVIRTPEAAKNIDYDRLPLVSISADEQNRTNDQKVDGKEQLVEKLSISDQSNDVHSSSDEELCHSTDSIFTAPADESHDGFLQDVISTVDHAEQDQFNGQVDSFISNLQSSGLPADEECLPKNASDCPSSPNSTEQLTQLRLEHRIDYQLPVARYENPYLSVFTSHGGYWENVDVSMLILSHLFDSYKSVG